MINRYIPTSNHTISTLQVYQYGCLKACTAIILGALYCKFNKYNFYSIEHPYFQDFQIIEDKNSSNHFLKKNTGFLL